MGIDFVNNIFPYCLEQTLSYKNQLPDYLSEKQKKHVVDTIYNFMNITYDILTERNSDISYVRFMTDLVGKFTFYKSIDLYRLNLEKDIANEVLQNIAYVVFEISRMAAERNLSKDDIYKIAKHHAQKEYKNNINKLYASEVITKDMQKFAIFQCNINEEIDNIDFNNVENSDKSEQKTNFLKKEKFGYILLLICVVCKLLQFITFIIPQIKI